MPDVYNWQLGRKMHYTYKKAYPKWQFAFVFNVNRCIGCQTCTMACKSTWTFSKGQESMWWNNVETKPYGGYPQHWDVKILELLEKANPGKNTWNAAKMGNGNAYGVYDGVTIFEAALRANMRKKQTQQAIGYIPADKEWRFPNIYEDTAAGDWSNAAMKKTEGGMLSLKDGTELPEHKRWFFYLQRLCNHCSYPACLAACPRKAIYKRKEDGIVLIDQNRCRGYKKCVEQCPYKKPMFRGTTRISEKCIACYPRIEGKDQLDIDNIPNSPMETRCMAACVGQIRMQGLVRINEDGSWAEDRQNPLYYLVKVAKVALPLYPQLGTQPNGYYIPPRNAPRDYLRQMFGPGVDEAIDKYLVPNRELLAVMNLFRKHRNIIFKYKIKKGPKVFENKFHGKKFEMFNDTVIAYDKKNKEIFRTTIEEPIHVRPDKHSNLI